MRDTATIKRHPWRVLTQRAHILLLAVLVNVGCVLPPVMERERAAKRESREDASVLGTRSAQRAAAPDAMAMQAFEAMAPRASEAATAPPDAHSDMASQPQASMDAGVTAVSDIASPQALGAACSGAAQCETGFCTDGFCCEMTCPMCSSCAAQGLEGKCQKIRSDDDEGCDKTRSCVLGVCTDVVIDAHPSVTGSEGPSINLPEGAQLAQTLYADAALHITEVRVTYTCNSGLFNLAIYRVSDIGTPELGNSAETIQSSSPPSKKTGQSGFKLSGLSFNVNAGEAVAIVLESYGDCIVTTNKTDQRYTGGSAYVRSSKTESFAPLTRDLAFRVLGSR